jgi:hypothetical protein
MLSSMKSLDLISIERQTISNELLLNVGGAYANFLGPCLHLIEATSFYLWGKPFSDIEFTMETEANNELPFSSTFSRKRDT